MNINKDQLVEGPFGSNACYEQNFVQDGKEITTWVHASPNLNDR